MSLITGYLYIVTCFLHKQNYGASLPLRAYRGRAQDSQVMIVSPLKCQSLSKLLL